MILKVLIYLMEAGFIPDSLIRLGIRKLCQERLDSLIKSAAADLDYEKNYASKLSAEPVAVETQAANQQHYEVPAEFFKSVLGKNLKYSCGFWPSEHGSLDISEDLALEATIERAELSNNMEILELGCGWGSLSLRMAQKFPGSRITVISNSNSQRAHIEAQAKLKGLGNLRVFTRDVSKLENPDFEFRPFDRVVSVEMFEHMLNYEILLSRIAGWLKPQGKLFVHIFTHQKYPYRFETVGEDNWMGKYFFTGGQMPSHRLFGLFQKDLVLSQTWFWPGTHYQKTSEAWLVKMDSNSAQIMNTFRKVYGEGEYKVWFQRWRIFFIAVAEMFGFKAGQEWGVSHYLFVKK